MSRYKLAGGVAWCSVHHGVRNEDESGHCDMFDDGHDTADCSLHDMFYTCAIIETVEVES